ncbi:Bug family tripartite tricarboxylate transporter substrate binding protein [Candidatus Pelagibacter sp. FZCC0015]|uniref:Bug family tripartite tricarboxylate transporter substrate binding protein n=1 Tax=Candidatus Pelagibacter sp. FZCC0015 TaxID=2268451 RepID=UPI0011A54297|nr:transporter [Candidatus Pelagibacter sp. FZCC0015]
MIKKLITALAAIIITMSSALAVDYSGKTVTIWIPFKAGGGSDTWARAIGPAFSKNLPGNPTVVVKNVTDGKAIGASNKYFAEHGKDKDGSVVFGTSGSVQLPFIFKDERVRYQYKNMVPIFASGTGGVVYVRKDMGVTDIIKDFDKLKGSKLVYGSQGKTSLDAVPILAFDMLGLDVNVVYGMKGRKAGRAAILRGETTIDYQTTASYLKHVKPLVEKGEMVAVMTWGAPIDGKVARDPNFPDLPSFPEVYEAVTGNKFKGTEAKSWTALFYAGFATQKYVMLPKSASKKVVKAWQKAAEAIVNDPEAMKVLNKKLGKYDQVTGSKNLKSSLKKATSVDSKSEKFLQEWKNTK